MGINNMDNLIFHPELNRHPSDNEQTIEMTIILSKRYNVVSFEWFLGHLFNKKNKIIYLNWYENIIGNGNFFLQIVNYLVKLFVLEFCKIRHIKIIYAVHNKTPHGVVAQSFLYKTIIRPFIKKALNIADVIVIHSKKTSEYIECEYGIKNLDKVKYIPIGKDEKYITNRKDIHLRQKLGIDDSILCLGYVGRLTRYKQIEKAIIAFQNCDIPARLIIVGSADENYKKELNSYIHSKNVIIDYRYVDDYLMNEIISSLDAMILPYDYSCLNSGPMLQAFLNGTNVIGTAIGTAYDFPLELIYTYDYISDKEHIKKIENMIEKVYQDFNTGELQQKNNLLQEYTLSHNSWKDIEKIVNTII